ncbi:DUF4435 domain-containing protein [Anabaena cylindrica FACHB-243]|uniref:DUF4435 domain-containing protein n=1 Tax=Anabaena cylindrica (strain ATCC 27899 / PCC 7122) TaxID=272123 RepID=K9ZBP1_ANACC|nr:MULTISPECIES: DUF4435 domain-containing protein [Anabaena]AFZ56606.1 hypothetical protein Anacy_1033 [Anabaena cylindrica PCC 7122]MBD2416222.1 DUF4435 domain-containing protein [Anabaena cylindrica FACHB-243]MBY5285335.1 DUF4435 domain-containing protein [Anabaena sp. CCAP 1446/1C]MBY5310784.1 DUF4435 domain-containing protein [Anabaena sp. CCAP 1446/1C]MCM2408899.1 DUF4435 domain-containing protein [Anabaena sp. CCAP 1446/1C]
MSVATLREFRNRPAVAFTEFSRQYKQDESALYCFFEGEDDKKYYGIRIRNIARPIKYSYFSCDGKKGVLDIHRIITNRKSYSQVRAAYFIDRDFDVSIKNTEITGIYETPCYSIENLYTAINSFCEILRTEFKLAELDIDFNNCKNLYINLQKEFHDAVELLNIWIACQREKRADLKLSGFDISKLVQIDLDNITSNYTINELHTQFPKAITVTQEEIDLKQSDLCLQERQKSFRGKFEIVFLCKFIQKLIEEANKGNPKYFTKKIKVTLNLRETTLISDLSQYADTPDCLVDYLESFRTSVN